ncbi:glycophorin-C isoform X1 [Tachysurus fulvidraco]|uniref:glycophorin-C isoform X1 n=1 Tax=Tachysurus fulvidraco TaxID=1234273 RepID=UPI000F4E617D|nr:glycophorin-C isoform X1 [Tachysurus fulvidraco]XP_027008186.1 glycophorin-C isoform X1 [Tachysurus fulvidraco]XP_027008188.1 glycophorin-C isoform X1 [Tachysurus fulvidraco]XP_027008189.1 glycophorin-C isoform X1 [Tachysurus fulvidraco]XP_047670702.1 glycophorin-C isoform X1 [Tachysurus fulvidraco]
MRCFQHYVQRLDMCVDVQMVTWIINYHTGASPVTEGAADENGSYFNVIIGAVIAAVVLVFICLLLVLFRYMYRHKGTYHTNEAKGSEFAETADAALQGDPALQDAVDESKKEYFI